MGGGKGKGQSSGSWTGKRKGANFSKQQISVVRRDQGEKKRVIIQTGRGHGFFERGSRCQKKKGEGGGGHKEGTMGVRCNVRTNFTTRHLAFVGGEKEGGGTSSETGKRSSLIKLASGKEGCSRHWMEGGKRVQRIFQAPFLDHEQKGGGESIQPRKFHLVNGRGGQGTNESFHQDKLFQRRNTRSGRGESRGKIGLQSFSQPKIPSELDFDLT